MRAQRLADVARGNLALEPHEMELLERHFGILNSNGYEIVEVCEVHGDLAIVLNKKNLSIPGRLMCTLDNCVAGTRVISKIHGAIAIMLKRAEIRPM